MLWYRDGYGCNIFGNGIFGNMVMAVAMGIILLLIILTIFKIINVHEKESIKILKRRYSKGEMNKEEYNEMKKDIK
ncbi:SHOCT domain-containing protein [Psychrilyobacter atlanticus]|uniref:SHOCT domain-containing protein n=1 Tax=Psychrilyobacter atlanticus TaxID=271091 RepID=UPI000410A6E5|nr:SHOCT domain-containing protein [Psychrilyobacter atlanticus]